MRRILSEVFVIFLIALLMATAAAFWFIAYKGRPLLLKELSAITNRPVTVGKLRPGFPVGIILENTDVDGLLKVPRAFVVVDPGELMRGRIRLTSVELDHPVINIHPTKHQDEILPPAGIKEAAATGKKPAGALRSFVLEDLKIHEGTIMVQAPASGRTWVIENVEMNISNLSFGTEAGAVRFLVTASLERMNIPFVGHFLKAKGEINWPLRTIDANIESLDDNGRVGLEARVTGKANDVLVEGKARLSGTQQKQASGAKARMIEDLVLTVAEATDTDIETAFSFHTPLDRFDPSPIKLSGTITTSLNSSGTSGNIVGALKALGEEVFGSEGAEVK